MRYCASTTTLEKAQPNVENKTKILQVTLRASQWKTLRSIHLNSVIEPFNDPKDLSTRSPVPSS